MPRTNEETSSKSYTPSDPHGRTGFTDIFPQAEEPKTELARYRILSPTSGLRVSPLCLGAMSIGTQWTGFMGGKALDYDQSAKFLDAFVEAGGNFIDTANNYQDEESEWIIGDWMKARGNRDEMVIATKYTTPYTHRKETSSYPGIAVNFAGNHKKSLRISLERSLKKLQTDYIDILYVHWWDHSTSIPELMQSLNEVVVSGKVLYLGISDTPAWVVSAANEYAKSHGFAQFVIYQGLYNLATRDMERDIIPMCRTYGMALAPWGALGQGRFKSPKDIEEGARLRGGASDITDAEKKGCEALQAVAEEVGNGAKIVDIALAWVRAKVGYVFPIIGGTSTSHLAQNIGSLKIELTPAQVAKLEEAMPFDPGFPTGRFGTDPHYLPNGKPDSFLLNSSGNLKFLNLPL